MHKKQTCLVVTLVLFLCVFIVLVFVSVRKFTEYECENVHGSSGDRKYTRSGSNILLTQTNIEDFTCVVPIANVQLSGEASVIIYETLCKNLYTKQATVDRKSLTYENVIQPMVVLSEDFDENYFLKGTIDVVVNATFNESLSETDIYVCLFVDYKVFTDFTNSDKDWRMYIKKGICRRTSEEQFKTTYNVTGPNYIFIALATTNALDTLQFGYNGTRYEYDIPTFTNMTKLCSLGSDKPDSSTCNFSISDTGESDDLCLLASNGINADSSFSYSTIILNFPYIKQRDVVGTVLSTLFACLCLVATIIVLVVLLLRLRKSFVRSVIHYDQ